MLFKKETEGRSDLVIFSSREKRGRGKDDLFGKFDLKGKGGGKQSNISTSPLHL